jgi:tetratricopeptide (TPR) repeat protein
MKRSKTARYLCQLALALATGLILGMPVRGQQIPGYSDNVRYAFDARELALLPRYCMYTLVFRDNVQGGNSPEEITRWTLLMGPGYNHVHHYCWGLMYTNRALLLVRDQQTRTHYLSNAVGEFEYVIQRVPRDFKLLPEILTRKGENLIRLERNAEGIEELERAIALKADYWPPYAAISDYYRSFGEPAKARKWLEEGLSASPNSHALTRRLAELDAQQAKGNSRPPAAH